MHEKNFDKKEFIEALNETKSDEFIIKNIECKLSQNPWCQNLWKEYIKFLNAKCYEHVCFF